MKALGDKKSCCNCQLEALVLQFCFFGVLNNSSLRTMTKFGVLLAAIRSALMTTGNTNSNIQFPIW